MEDINEQKKTKSKMKIVKHSKKEGRRRAMKPTWRCGTKHQHVGITVSFSRGVRRRYGVVSLHGRGPSDVCPRLEAKKGLPLMCYHFQGEVVDFIVL